MVHTDTADRVTAAASALFTNPCAATADALAGVLTSGAVLSAMREAIPYADPSLWPDGYDFDGRVRLGAIVDAVVRARVVAEIAWELSRNDAATWGAIGDAIVRADEALAPLAAAVGVMSCEAVDAVEAIDHAAMDVGTWWGDAMVAAESAALARHAAE